MKLKDVIKNIAVNIVMADENIEITGVTNNSRAVKPGYLFIAVRGFQSDGHRYIASAIENGAVCIVCEEMPENVKAPYITVEDSRRSEALIAASFYGNPAKKLRMIGVTGTNGKTTVTTLTRQIIEKTTGEMCGLIGTNKNIVGGVEIEAERTTPDSIELQALLHDMVEAGCAYAVMEVSSHALYLDRVCGIQYEVGAFTNLTEDHLDFHKTMDRYAEAKAILFAQCDRAVINIDDSYAPVMRKAAQCPVYTVSAAGKEANLNAFNVELHPDRVEFSTKCGVCCKDVTLHIPGMFSVYNALTALAIAVNLGIPMDKAVWALGQLEGVKGRAEIVPTDTDYTVLIDYAHSPDALENILRTVRGFAKGRVVILFGCGGDRERTKRPIMGSIAVELADFAYITSDNPRTEVPGEIINEILEGVKGTETPYQVIENRKEAIFTALKNAQKDDVIILAGKGHEDYQIIGKEKLHFDEREIVKEYFNNSGKV